MMNEYDVIVIGSGLGGLECATTLSKEGFNVCVLEKNELFGGCFQTYTRKGRMLDTGIHYVGSLGEGQVLNQYFRYFGIMDKLDVRRLDEDCFDRILYNNHWYEYAVGHDRFVDRLACHFPHERDNLRRYAAMLKEVGNLVSVDNLKQGIIAREGFRFFYMSAAQTIAGITPNVELQNVLAATSLLYGGVKDTSTFYHHGMVNNSYIEGPYRFVKGSMQVSNELIGVIRANGGTVRNNAEVTRIIIEEGRARGVIVNTPDGEEQITGKYIISNMHPQLTFALTDKTRGLRNAYLSRVNGLDNTYGVFTAYLIMAKNMYAYENRNSYVFDGDEVWYDRQKHLGKVNCCMVSHQSTDPGGRYADVVSLLVPMHFDEVSRWQDTRVSQRGDDYKAFKAAKVNEMLAFLSERGISFDGKIEAIYSTTPLSYRDYTGTTHGSAYGVVKDYKYPLAGFISPKTKIDNLLLTGQNLNLHGALGVTLTSMITCSALLGESYLAKKVGHA